jgi:import inner membrane translocase subunit TIM23
MTTALKTVVALRWPATRGVGLVAQCCPRASSSLPAIAISNKPSARSFTVASNNVTAFPRLPLRATTTRATTLVTHHAALPVPAVFARLNGSLAESASKAPNATHNKTASDLAAKHQTKPSPTGANVAADPAATAAGPALDWNSFFKLRQSRRRYQTFFAIVTALSGAFGGAALLSAGAADSVIALVPLEPFITLGLLVFTFAGLGWLAGPAIGSEAFYMLNRTVRRQIRVKESLFLSRIKKNRADPSNSSASNPVPDFYGEKIQSVAGYRRWLKDQRAFNRKKNAAFV